MKEKKPLCAQFVELLFHRVVIWKNMFYQYMKERNPMSALFVVILFLRIGIWKITFHQFMKTLFNVVLKMLIHGPILFCNLCDSEVIAKSVKKYESKNPLSRDIFSNNRKLISPWWKKTLSVQYFHCYLLLLFKNNEKIDIVQILQNCHP